MIQIEYSWRHLPRKRGRELAPETRAESCGIRDEYIVCCHLNSEEIDIKDGRSTLRNTARETPPTKCHLANGKPGDVG